MAGPRPPEAGERGSTGRRAFDPSRIQPWDGPRLHAGHRLLVEACLGRESAAGDAWRRWLERSDFEHLDGASYELAAIAVERLGERAGNGSEAARSRGWLRRARVMSALAIEAARRGAGRLRRSGYDLVAVGDLAEHPWTRMPVRSVELLALEVPEEVLVEGRLEAAGEGRSALVDSRRLPIAIGPNAAWHGRWTDDCGGGVVIGTDAPTAETPWRTPTGEEALAMLLARGWRWRPPGGIRWVISSHRLLAGEGDFETGAVAEAARRDGTIGLLVAATGELARLPGFAEEIVGPRLDALRGALQGLPMSMRQRWRAARITRPPSWGAARLVDRLRRLVGPRSR